MQLEEIQKLWEKDAVIDDTAYDTESNKIPQLHSKYFKILSDEKLRLRQAEYKLKRMSVEKYEFIAQGTAKEHKDKGWKYPSDNIILKVTLTDTCKLIKS